MQQTSRCASNPTVVIGRHYIREEFPEIRYLCIRFVSPDVEEKFIVVIGKTGNNRAIMYFSALFPHLFSPEIHTFCINVIVADKVINFHQSGFAPVWMIRPKTVTVSLSVSRAFGKKKIRVEAKSDM